MKSMKLLVALVLVATMAFVSASALAETIDVKIWDNNQLAGIKQIADEWTAQSGIDVNIQVVDWGNYWTLLEAGATGGDMPDVFWMHSNEVQKYMQYDMLLDLTDYIAKSDVVDPANYYEGIMNLYSLNGKQYAVAKDHDTIALIYNKKLFDECGVAYPDDTWTWDDFHAAAKAISDKGKEASPQFYGAAMNTSNNQDGWYNLVYDFGGKVISEDQKTSGWDDENTIKAMNFLGEMLADGSFAPQGMVAENGNDRLFNNGLAAMITQGSWNIITFYNNENKDDYGWAVLPYADVNGNGACDEGERCSIYNGLGWAAAADVANPDACWSLIEWFSSKENQLKQAELGVTMAGYIGASDPFANAFDGMNIDAFLKMETEGTLVFRPYSKSTAVWEDKSTQGLVTAWNDPSQMETVLRSLAAEMNGLLAQE